MPKIDVNKVAEILKNNEVDPKLLCQIVEEMNILAQAEATEEKPPAVKKQWVRGSSSILLLPAFG